MTITREQVEQVASELERNAAMYHTLDVRDEQDQAATLLRDLWQRVEAAEDAIRKADAAVGDGEGVGLTYYMRDYPGSDQEAACTLIKQITGSTK